MYVLPVVHCAMGMQDSRLDGRAMGLLGGGEVHTMVHASVNSGAGATEAPASVIPVPRCPLLDPARFFFKAQY